MVASQLTCPWPGAVWSMTVSVSPSRSVSLGRTETVTGVSSGVTSESSLATGGSLTGSTVTVTSAVSQAPWSSHTW